jgi:uncharacterized protein YndB with AHSA1/START domain
MVTDVSRIPEEDLAQFVDRWTVRYVRLLSVPVPRVWEAVTTAEQMNLWFIPVVSLEARLGGRCSFSWGQAESDAIACTVTRFEPMKVFEVATDADPESILRFELEPVDAKTRFTFTDRFSRIVPPDALALAAASPGNKLLALPAGSDTPIRAGILEGYHLVMDGLGEFLSRDWAPGEIARASAEAVARANRDRREPFEGAEQPASPLAELYYDYIRERCPPPGSRRGLT